VGGVLSAVLAKRSVTEVRSCESQDGDFRLILYKPVYTEGRYGFVGDRKVLGADGARSA